MRENLTDKQLHELTKLYPEIRIPTMQHADYYLELLSRTVDVDTILNRAEGLAVNYDDFAAYKHARMNECIEWLKEHTNAFNELPIPEMSKSQYPSEFNNWSSGGVFYYSIDMREANWAVIKHALKMDQPDWTTFATATFGLHPLIAHSKTFRQHVFGNLNPKRQQTFQKYYMLRYAEGVQAILNVCNLQYASQSKIVMVSTDELIVEINRLNTEDVFTIEAALEKYVEMATIKLRGQMFVVNKEVSYGETVVIKEYKKKRKMHGVPGNRYFMHYKNLMLRDYNVDDRDLYFEPEKGRLAKWVI